MTPLKDLPPEMLVKIFSRCFVEDVLTLRIVSKHFKEIITRNLCQIAPASARATFGNMVLLLDPSPNPSHTRDKTSKEGQDTLSWFKNLLPKYLASMLLSGPLCGENRGYPPHLCLPAEDESANDHRERLEHGFKILKRLNLTAKEATMRWDHTIVPKLSQAPPGQHELFGCDVDVDPRSSLEATIGMEWMDYICKLPKTTLSNYLLVRDLICVKVFRRHARNPSAVRRGTYGENRIGKKDCTASENTWDEWFLMHEGGDLLLKQWLNRLPENEQHTNEKPPRKLTTDQKREVMARITAMDEYDRRVTVQIIRQAHPHLRAISRGNEDEADIDQIPEDEQCKLYMLFKSKLPNSHPAVIKKDYYSEMGRQFYNNAGKEGRKRARHFCHRVKVYHFSIGDPYPFWAWYTWSALEALRTKKIGVKPLQTIELRRKKKGGLLGKDYRNVGFQDNEEVPFFVFLDCSLSRMMEKWNACS